MNYAHIKDGKVHNVIVAEADFIARQEGALFVECPDGFGIGDEWDGVSLKKPVVPPAPEPTKEVLIAREKALHKQQVLDAFLEHEGPPLDAELKRLKKSFEDKKKAIEG